MLNNNGQLFFTRRLSSISRGVGPDNHQLLSFTVLADDYHYSKQKNVTHCDASVWALSCSLATTNEILFLRTLFSFPPGTEMFYFPGYAIYVIRIQTTEVVGFPHSETSGSKVARYLPEVYRHHATSFIAFLSQGIHHMLLIFRLGNLKTTIRGSFKPHVFTLPLMLNQRKSNLFILLYEINFPDFHSGALRRWD